MLLLVLPHQRRRSQAIEHRHLNIDKDSIVCCCFEELEGLSSIAGLGERNPLRREEGREDPPVKACGQQLPHAYRRTKAHRAMGLSSAMSTLKTSSSFPLGSAEPSGGS